LLALILGAAGPSLDGYTGHKGFFIFVAIFGLIGTLPLFIVGLFNLRSLCFAEKWKLIVNIIKHDERIAKRFYFQDLFWSGLMSLLYFIGSIVIAVAARWSSIFGAAAVSLVAASLAASSTIIWNCFFSSSYS
jgi:hypothetical protein